MKNKWRCGRCGGEFDASRLYICEMNILRCGACFRLYRREEARIAAIDRIAAEHAAICDQIEGRAENEAMCQEEERG